MQTLKALKHKLLKQWQAAYFHKRWLDNQLHFPWQLSLKRPTDKALLHEFASVAAWQQGLESDCAQLAGVSVLKKQVQYATMGRQHVPYAIKLDSIEALARLVGKWTEWQQFVQDSRLISQQFPQLGSWQGEAIGQIRAHAGQWPQLLAIAAYFVHQPRPNLYLRELKIPGVDSKFIEQKKQIIKRLLDEVLPTEGINAQFNRISDHGFEQRFGLKFDQPQIRFRLLDSHLSPAFSGMDDLSVPISAFASLDLAVDRVFITENLTNGLAFPAVKNALVIFGKGYGIQMLKQIPWLKNCALHYWGDIDSDGFAMLSQLRGYFPHARSLLMDEATLLASKAFWGEEPANKKQTPEQLAHLSSEEAQLYQRLKADYWRPRLRLEQERIPFERLQMQLKQLE